MSNYKETAVVNVPKESFAYLKADIGFEEHIVKHISSELAERIMRILEYEKEVIVRQSDLRVSEFTPTNSVEYRRQISWSPLVRCKDCKHYYADPWGYGNCVFEGGVSRRTKESDFCSWAERREDG